MKAKFEWFFRAYCVVLALLLGWAVWASAQPAKTNPPTATETNSLGGLEKKLTDLEIALEEHDLIFHFDKVDALRSFTVFGQPLWKYLSSLVFIFLAFYISKLLDFLTGVWLKKWAERTETRFDDLLLEALRGPVKVIAFVIFLHIGLGVFKWPQQVQVLLSKGLIVIVAFSLTYVSLK